MPRTGMQKYSSRQGSQVGGWGFYADAATTQPAAQVVANHATNFTVITNDALGFAVEELPYDTVATLWDESTSKVAPYNNHDTFHVRWRMVVENYSGAAPFVELGLFANGTTGFVELNSIPLLKGGVQQVVELSGPVFVGGDFLANGGQTQMRYDGNGSIDVYSVSVFIERVYQAP